MPPRAKKIKTFDSVEANLRSMDQNILVDMIKEASNEEFIQKLISLQKKGKVGKGKKSKTELIIEHNIESYVDEYDEEIYTDAYGPERDGVEYELDKEAKSLDGWGRKKGVIFSDVSKANIAAREQMTDLIEDVKRGKLIDPESEDNSEDECEEKEDVEGKSEYKDGGVLVKQVPGEGGKLTLKATLSYYYEGENEVTSDITVSVVNV